MKPKEIRQFLKNNLSRILIETGLDDWNVRITVKQKACQEDRGKKSKIQADCHALNEYKDAKIRLYAPNISAKDLESILIHELCHCILSPNRLLWDAMAQLRLDSDAFNVLASIHNSIEELMVLNLEKLIRAKRTSYGKNNR